MQVPTNAVVLVADGRKMLFLRNQGDNEYLNLVVEDAAEQKDDKTSDQGTDYPGRASTPARTPASAVSQTDWHQLGEDRFAIEAADMLKSRALVNNFDALFVIAPPKTLAELRKHYHKEVTERLKGELNKDLTGHPISDIEKALQTA